MDKKPLTVDEVSARLRSIRVGKGWTLSDVERYSAGKIKAVVLGSYERGARTLSVKKALYIAELYGVPAGYLFSGNEIATAPPSRTFILDLRTVYRRVQQLEGSNVQRYQIIARFSQSIVENRQDWNGEVLSMRDSDIPNIALLLGLRADAMVGWLDEEKVLLQRSE